MTRFDILFSNDPFMAILDPRVRTQLVNVLVYGWCGVNTRNTKRVLNTTPFARLWSDEFKQHVEILCETVKARPPEDPS